MDGRRFGTDGWRAIIAEDFTLANVCVVAQAIACYLKESGLSRRGVVVGYDNRFLSERFAAAVAEVMAGNEILCRLPAESTPTPVIAYAIKENEAGGAVMITASHNPPEYNGIKFIPEYAGPAAPEITQMIEKHLRMIKSPYDVISIPLDDARQRGLIRDINPRPGYLNHLRNILDYRAICGSKIKLIVDPMWGAGIGYVKELFREFGENVEFIHDYRDVLFGGSMPEPTAAALGELRKTVVERNADLGLALDGDADRFGVVDRDGVYVTPNEVLYLLLYYILEYRRWRGPVARTVATTHMLDRIAGDYGLPVVETPVGFKYICQSLIHHHSILGGEESGGLSIQRHIPEKDGILALALIVEMVSVAGKPLRDFQQMVTDKFGRLVSSRLDLKCAPGEKERILARLREWSPRELSGERVMERNLKDGVKIILESGDWVLVRPSGTEPLFRIYAEASDEGRLRKLQENARAALGL